VRRMMTKDFKQNRDRRYFIDIELKTLKVINYGYDHKKSLDKGRQTDPKSHRLFLTKGQYNKFIERCGSKTENL
jgi:hypothetical protein